MSKQKNVNPDSTITEGPFVFISHDTRDADLAKAFSELLQGVSAGMLKCFRASDRKGTEGIPYGDVWYKTLMSNLRSASDVVCLFTEHSIDRPWILFEAGFAKGRLNIPVHGVALGVPLNRISTGPFSQFQTCDDGENSLKKLVTQLSNRVPSIKLDEDTLTRKVGDFKNKIIEVLSNLDAITANKQEQLSCLGEKREMGKQFDLYYRASAKILDVLGISLGSFFSSKVTTDDLKEKIRRGCHVRLALIYPGSTAFYLRAFDQTREPESHHINGYKKVGERLIELHAKLLSQKDEWINYLGSLEVYLLQSLPYFSYFRTDKKLIVGFYFHSIQCNRAPCIEISQSSSLFSNFTGCFDSLCNNRDDSLIQRILHFEGGEQRELQPEEFTFPIPKEGFLKNTEKDLFDAWKRLPGISGVKPI